MNDPQAGPPATLLLHIGAGQGADLKDHLRAGYDRIVLVEPNPECWPALEEAAAGRSKVTLIRAAVGDRGPRATLNVLNLADLSSLEEPEGLAAILPGIRVIERPEVDVLDAAALCAMLPELRDGAGAHRLVIQAPGSEASILRALDGNGTLRHFGHLAVTCGGGAGFYAGAVSADTLQDWLETRGFQLLRRESAADPDWPELHFEPNPYWQINLELRTRLEAAETAVRALQDRQDALTEEREAEVRALEAEQETLAETHADEVRKLRHALAQAQRLERIARSDLQELKARHCALFSEKQRQDRLVLRIIDRLEGGSPAEDPAQ